MEDITDFDEIQPVSPAHVVFLHNEFKNCYEDQYILDMVNALQEKGHKITVYASELGEANCLEELNQSNGNLNLSYCGWWLPNSWKSMRSILMALRIILFPPTPVPTVIVMDIEPIALYLLSFLNTSKLIYVTHFSTLQQAENYTKFIKINPNMITVKALKYANEIVVHGETLAEVFHRSFPTLKKDIRILHPCVETGLWKEESVEIERIVPDLPNPNFLLVCFGSYKTKSNFKLVLDAFKDVLIMSDPNLKNNIHLVIAGQCSETDLEEQVNLNKLQEYTKEKCFASQVTFLRQLPTVYRKTLIEESMGVIIPCMYELFPETVLAAMACSRTIIATNTGFPNEILKHRVSAILLEPHPHLFAVAMYKVLTNPTIPVFISNMAYNLYVKNYSYAAFKKKINGLVKKYAKLQLEFRD